MLIKNTITKKSLEKIINDTFYTFGDISSSSLLDSLKLLGFYYATNAGISINIEDLKTPKIKTKIIKEANDYTEKISENWREGLLSDTERFQSIIDNWNFVTETLKNRIIEYYQDFDPLNNLYIMAFSGARGNMSQVRQLIGMRGLMSDQEGNIIDLPIQTNFREGLTSIDYIISSYGARKGIVDTALKTADSGYLTRRLIYTAQDLIIREKDCRTNQGLILFLNKNKLSKNLLGRSILSYKTSLLDQTINIDKVIDRFFLEELKIKKIPLVKIRSSLTCKSLESICQKCYGWDLSKTKLISLGEAVGITAAQSIGEPGTQLTMRTFHTGGVFTGELLNQIVSPFSEVPSYFTLLPSNQKNSLFWFINDETDQKFISSRGIKRWVPYKQDNDLNFLTLSDYHKYSKNYGFQALEKVNNKDSLIGVYVDRYSSDTIFEIKPNKYLLLETILPIKTYVVSSTAKILVNEGEFIDLAQPLTEGIIDPHELLSILFNYHLSFDSFSLACLRSVQKFQLILINSIQAIYQSQGVNIDCKHIEIIVRQMTSKVIIKSSGYTPFLSGELVRLSFMLELFKSFKNIKNYKIPKCEPILLSATNISLAKDGFLSSACFQETKRILAKAAIEGNKDWLRGLKESIIVGTTKLASPIVEKYALKSNLFYINYRWLGGMLTNWPTVQKKIERLKTLEQFEIEKDIKTLSKKEYSQQRKELDKLKKLFNGIKNMKELPDLVIFTNQLKDLSAIQECLKLGIPSICIVDTNCDPDLIPYPIPANDDSSASIDFILNYLTKNIIN
eukprot:gene11929-13015_t